MYDREAYNKRVEWFTQARFGMFIHFGLYSIPARGEWVRSLECISSEEYQPYFDAFNPRNYDPIQWARLAREAGMKYAVMTAKHHDGFCLFDSQFTDYKSTNTPCGRDLIRECVDAFRAEGLRVGFYYSLLDWHHKDYPHYGDKVHPMRANEAYKGEMHDFSNYLRYFHSQVRELCTNYGQIDLLWFDFSYDDMTGEKWKASELVKMVRSLQPGILLDNRLEGSGEGFGSLITGDPSPYSGDFVSPEQIIPPEGIVDQLGNPVIWEACITMNNNWGYTADDNNFKPAPMIIKKLVECVSKGGNLLVNIGPDADGNIPTPSIESLEGVAVWMGKNSASIYGCGMSAIPKPEYGRITQNDKKLYYHVMESPVGYVLLHGLKKEDIQKITLLPTGKPLVAVNNWITSNYDGVFVSLGESPILPDQTDTVIAVELR